jgi:hypothetical protein
MSQSLSQIYVHLIFSTKLRQPFLQVKSRHYATSIGKLDTARSP